MIRGQGITLRAPEPDVDVDAMFRWENDSHAWSDGRTRAPMSRHQLWEYAENYSSDILSVGQARFIICRDDEIAQTGCIDLYDIDTLNRKAGVGVYVDARFRRMGIAKSALVALCEYCRVELGLHQLWAVVSGDNPVSCRLFESCGFVRAGRLRSWIRHGESYSDAYVMQRLLIK